MEGDVLDSVGTIATGAMDGMAQYVTIGIWVMVGLVGVGALVWWLKHKHLLSIRVLTKNGMTMPMKDKAMEIMVDGVKHWKLLKSRKIIPVPPSEALINIGKNGKLKYFVEFSWSEENGYIPLIYDVNSDNFLNKVITYDKGSYLKGVFQPFTTQQRSLFVGQLRKAENRRKKDMLERLAQLAVPLVMAALFISVLVFWEDIAKPAKDIAAQNVAMQAQTLEVTENLAEISSQNARITTALTGADIEITQRLSGGVS